VDGGRWRAARGSYCATGNDTDGIYTNIVFIDGNLFQAAARERVWEVVWQDLLPLLLCSKSSLIQQQSSFHTTECMPNVLSFLSSFLQAKFQLNCATFGRGTLLVSLLGNVWLQMAVVLLVYSGG